MTCHHGFNAKYELDQAYEFSQSFLHSALYISEAPLSNEERKRLHNDLRAAGLRIESILAKSKGRSAT